MYTTLQRRLLSVPVATLGLPALFNPTEFQLWEREADLLWHPDEGTTELLATLALPGVVVVFSSEMEELDLWQEKRNR